MPIFTWTNGGEAEVEALQGARITLLSTASNPPGRPLRATTSLGFDYQLKVRSCRQVSEQPLRYRIEATLYNLSKPARSALQTACGTDGEPDPPLHTAQADLHTAQADATSDGPQTVRR